MAAISGINLAMLPEEDAEFFEYLATTGEIWACWLGDNPREFKYAPAPPARFLKKFGRKIEEYGSVRLLLGRREDVLKPRVASQTYTIAGKKVRQVGIDYHASPLLWYSRGIINAENVLDRTNLSFHTSYFKGNELVRKPPEFVAWGRKVTAWLRRRATDEVPIHVGTYSIKATSLAAAAVKKGLKVS